MRQPQTQCEVCHKTDRGLQMLLCDGCDCGESQAIILLTFRLSSYQDTTPFVWTRR